ncbi:uncharacterized protein LOC116213147 [Punica granatum]|uniref:Uncharacterized protein LOC116190434 n=1 Tax=Punica granatum TaxID=22663 RepID=A0A6P8EEM1_PUNGR|nr:uncharacterized protein LOC116190434 [Punica granatum]XP_031403846.1 uncharacterized protein LOC116213147 [Punica granatum]
MAREIDMKRKPEKTVKFLCSYGGRILPRKSDGELRYVGGLTRVLAVHRSISYSELMAKLVEFCGFSVTLRCQLPGGDLETLVSVKSDEELANLLEEYEKPSKESSSTAPSPMKIRAVLAPLAKEAASVSPRPSSSASSSDFSPNHSPRYCSPPAGPSSPIGFQNGAGKLRCYPCYGPGLLPPPRVLCAAPCCRSHGQLSHPNRHRIWTN